MLNGKTGKLILGILFFGTLWGLSEASFGDWLYSQNIPHASIYLTTIALIILAAAGFFPASPDRNNDRLYRHAFQTCQYSVLCMPSSGNSSFRSRF